MTTDRVIFKYASNRNITFHGEIDSGYTRAEWDEMSKAAQDEELADALNNLVDIWVEGGE